MLSATTNVDGGDVQYAIGGRGLPVLFLHGWGLDHRVYTRSLRRLTSHNCRVIAPSLPGFGGTDGLSLHDQSVPAFARWVDGFLDAVGVDEPVVIMGHSFGGGIATAYAHDFGDRVRHLVILNAIGDPDAMRWDPDGPGLMDLGRSVTEAVRATLSRSTRGAAARHAQRVFLENAAREPLRVASTAMVAATADLRAEMAGLAERGLPVSVLWSDQDNVIPLSGFDTFCAAFGADGHVVSGGHSWLLTRPDAFVDILDNVLQVQRREHHTASVAATAAELQELLAETTLPAPAISMLLRDVSPLWLLSAPASTLAADLALCHPRLEPGEVRGVARRISATGAYRVTVVAPDRPGLLADTVAVMTNDGLSVESASATTWPTLDVALHSVTVRADTLVDQERWDTIGDRLTAAAHGDVEVPEFTPADNTEVVALGQSGDGMFVRVTSPDRVGLLAGICGWFASAGVSIESADVTTTGGAARDVFLVRGECDLDELRDHLRRPRPDRLTRLVRTIGIA